MEEIRKDEAHVISPLSVVDNCSKLRLISDLSYSNKFLSVPKFRYDDIRTIKDFFRKGEYVFKLDIKSGYHHLLEAHHKYLAFSLEIDGVMRYFAFTVLVFGLASAPFIFTKVVKIPIKHWRNLAILIFGSVDDILGDPILIRITKEVQLL